MYEFKIFIRDNPKIIFIDKVEKIYQYIWHMGVLESEDLGYNGIPIKKLEFIFKSFATVLVKKYNLIRIISFCRKMGEITIVDLWY